MVFPLSTLPAFVGRFQQISMYKCTILQQSNGEIRRRGRAFPAVTVLKIVIRFGLILAGTTSLPLRISCCKCPSYPNVLVRLLRCCSRIVDGYCKGVLLLAYACVWYFKALSPIPVKLLVAPFKFYF